MESLLNFPGHGNYNVIPGEFMVTTSPLHRHAQNKKNLNASADRYTHGSCISESCQLYRNSRIGRALLVEVLSYSKVTTACLRGSCSAPKVVLA
ncbi:hypothetical protein KP509_01G029000 [Ceratopteris richardii]|nr:hypothetical protein KP509_01G029000 [Ceratopteris richardii]